jgi:hypothetical protein
MNPPLPITDEVFTAFLKCKYKAYLKLTGESGEQSDYRRLQDRLAAEYRAAAGQEVLKDRSEADVVARPPSLVDAVRSEPSLITDVTVSDAGESSSLITDVTVSDAGESCRLDALEKLDPKPPRAGGSYRPVLFVHREKVTADDRLLLAFGASIVARIQGTPPTTGRIVYGREFKVSRVELPSLADGVQQGVAGIRRLGPATSGRQPFGRRKLRWCSQCQKWTSRHCSGDSRPKTGEGCIGPAWPLSRPTTARNRSSPARSSAASGGWRKPGAGKRRRKTRWLRILPRTNQRARSRTGQEKREGKPSSDISMTAARWWQTWPRLHPPARS